MWNADAQLIGPFHDQLEGALRWRASYAIIMKRLRTVPGSLARLGGI